MHLKHFDQQILANAATFGGSNGIILCLVAGLSIIVVASALWLIFSRSAGAGSLAIVFVATSTSAIIALQRGLLPAGINLFCIGILCSAIVFLSDRALVGQVKQRNIFRIRPLLAAGSLAIVFSTGLTVILGKAAQGVALFQTKYSFTDFSAFLVNNYDGMILFQVMGLLLLCISAGIMQSFIQSDREL